MLSVRGEKSLSRPYSSGLLNKLYADDPYNPDTNPNGYIKLCSADNILPRTLIDSVINDEMFRKFDRNELTFYPVPGGEISTKKVVAEFINKHCIPNLKDPITYDSLVLIPGVTAGSDLLSHAIFDEDDYLITFSPAYYRFPNDFGDRGLIHIEHVNAYNPEINDFDIRIDLLEERFQKLKSEGKNVKAVLLVNPRNPDGGIYTEDQVKSVIEWTVKKHGLYLIFDEIYNKTIFEDIEKYKSGLSLIDEDDTIDKNKVIWMWGLSKIFSLPGLRVGCIYTKNSLILESVSRSLMYQGLNIITQHIVREVLINDRFITDFFNENRKLLKVARDYFIKQLHDNAGGKNIRIMPSKSAFFIMVNFGDYMKEKTFDEEDSLQQLFIKHKLLIVPGRSLSMTEPGWFRIVFSASNKEEIDIGINRLFNALKNNL